MPSTTPPATLELRYVHADLSVRALRDEDGTRRLEGRGVPFNQLSEDLGGFRERIAPGAFDLSKTIKAFWSHDNRAVLGSTKSNTLRLEERSDGIHFSMDLPDTTLGRDAFETINRGDVDGVSFGFLVKEDCVDEMDGEIVRTVLRGELIEVSPVAFPAYPQSNVSAELRDLIQSLQTENENGDSQPAVPLDTLRLQLDLLELSD